MRIVYNADMGGIPVSTRVPRELKELVERLMREEHVDRSTALRKLLLIGADEYRRRVALAALAEGRASFGEAAEMSGLNLWEFWDLVKARKIHWVAEDVYEDIRKGLAP